MLEIENGNFYYLELDGRDFIFSDYQEAVTEVKKLVAGDDMTGLDEDDIALFEVESGEEWQLKEISWLQFSLELMRGGN